MEVQTSDKKNLPRRMRYYQSTIDISILKQGVDDKELKASYVIFICSYDEFGRGRYIYTFENTCREEPGLTFGDDAYKVVVNTKGCRGEIREELLEPIIYTVQKKESIHARPLERRQTSGDALSFLY